LQKELTVVKSEYSLLKDKLLQETTALKEELHVAKVSFTNSRLYVIYFQHIVRASFAPSKETRPTSAAPLRAERRR
jgi:hypothetical protein